MTKPKVKKINSGVKILGEWEDICDYSRKLESVIEKYSKDKKSVDDFNGWRPREKETKKEVAEKTAEKACMNEKQVEKDFNGTDRELEEASENIKKTVDDISNGSNPGKGIKDASKNIGKVIGAKSIKSIRKMEKTIYERIMLKFNPFYFDTEEFSVNLEDKNGNGYVLTFNIPDEDLRKKIINSLKDEF
ncbi:MAG: DUF5828 family protein [Thermoplasmatota archaeon]